MKYTFKTLFLVMGLNSLIALTGCSTVGNSDKLGFTDESQDESFLPYTEAFEPAKQALLMGECSNLVAKMNSKYKDLTQDEIKDKLFNESSGLAIAEKGLVSLNCGDLKSALAYFDAAEQKMGKVEDYSASEQTGSFLKSTAGFLTGSEEMSEYQLRGYEKVMVLNYKSLVYLLNGDRAAYNATRNAIDRQIAEREVWEKEQKEIEDELAAKTEESKNNNFLIDIDAIKKAFIGNVNEYSKESASHVRSAFVNPLSDYMNAMVMEIDSLDDPSIADNAQKAYSEVLKSNPDCKTAIEASKSITPIKNQKLVHVIWSDNFAPHKKVEQMEIPGGMGIYNYSTFAPNTSKLHNAQVKYGNKTETLVSLAKMESLLFKDEEDSIFNRVSQMMAYMIRLHFAGKATALIAKAQKPDTRSWLSLPKEIKVARFYVPNDTKEIAFETFDVNNHKVTSNNVTLAEKGPTVVYAVTYDDVLLTYSNKDSWVGN